MIINYVFNEESFDYEVSNTSYSKAVTSILKEQSKDFLIEIILCADMCCLDLGEYLEEELKEYFRDKAYKEYYDRRYE